MKQILLSAAASAILGGSALAADLPVYTPAPEAPIVAPITAYTWTGFYVGASIGGYWRGGNNEIEFCDDPGDVTFDFDPEAGPFEFGDEASACVIIDDFDNDDDDLIAFEDGDDDDHHGGFLVNLHAGYNWQAGNFVIGAEGEIKFLFGNGNDDEVGFVIDDDESTFDLDSVDAYGSVRSGDDAHWLGLATLRAGALLGDRNQALAYLKGGLAFSEGGDLEGECYVTDGSPLEDCGFADSDDHDWNIGWTLGAGIEYKLTQNFSLGVEYLYVDLNRNGGDLDLEILDEFDEPVYGLEISDDRDDNLHLFEIRGTFHFGG